MKFRAVVFICAFFVVFVTGSCSSDNPVDPDAIIITGTVRLVGANFPSLIITDRDNQDWYVENDDMVKLSKMEHKEVKVSGKPEYEELTVSGVQMGVKHYLRNIKVLN
ncbi:MAG: hypothetical protein FWF22_03370 [Treponema sp.]|nr:hypothetical protein [Treponema sp.]